LLTRRASAWSHSEVPDTPALWKELWPEGYGRMSVSSEEAEAKTESSFSLVEESGGWAMQGCLWDQLRNSERSHYCGQQVSRCSDVQHNSDTELCDLFVLADTEEVKPKAGDETLCYIY